MLLDISTVIGPDIAAALYRGSQKHTQRDWTVWSYSRGGERKNKRGWKTNKPKKINKRSRHAGCGSVLWQQTNTVSAVAGVIAAPRVSYIDNDPHNDVQAWKVPGSQRVEVEKGGKKMGRWGGEQPKEQSIYRPVTRTESATRALRLFADECVASCAQCALGVTRQRSLAQSRRKGFQLLSEFRTNVWKMVKYFLSLFAFPVWLHPTHKQTSVVP